jgi:O-antigen/teichoic acid export membrane protein
LSNQQIAEKEILDVSLDARPVPAAVFPRSGMRHHGSQSLQRGLFKNSAVMMGCRVSAMVVSLITVPFVIAKLGLAGYGTWEVMLSVSIITTIFQAALGNTLLWRVSSAYGAGDDQEIRRLPRIGIGFTLLVFVISFPLVLTFRHQLVHLFHVPALLQPAAVIILPCIVGIAVLGGVNESLAAVIRGSQESGLVSVVITLAGFLNAAVMLTGLLLGFGLWSLLAGYAAAALCTCAGYFLRASWLYGRFNVVPILPSRSDIRATRRYFGLVSIGSFSILLRGETDKLVLAGFASTSWVGVYALAARMAALVMESSNFFYTPTIAAAGAMNGRGDWPAIRRLYATMSAVFPVAAGLVSVLVLSLYDRLTVAWLGRPVPGVGTLLFLVIAGNTVAVVLAGSGTSILKGIGKMETETTYVLVGLVLNILLTITLVATIGAIGTVIASTVSWSIGAALFLWLMHRRFDFPLKGTLRSIAALLYIAVVVAVAHISIPGWGSDTSRIHAAISMAGYAVPVSLAYMLPMLIVNRAYLAAKLRTKTRPAMGEGAL